MRFMRSVREVNVQRLREALNSFPEGGSGIVATVPAEDGADIVGSAVFFVGEDPTTCEFAITVQSNFGGVGLATTLLTALIDAARKRGLANDGGFCAGSERTDAASRQASRLQCCAPILTIEPYASAAWTSRLSKRACSRRSPIVGRSRSEGRASPRMSGG